MFSSFQLESSASCSNNIICDHRRRQPRRHIARLCQVLIDCLNSTTSTNISLLMLWFCCVVFQHATSAFNDFSINQDGLLFFTFNHKRLSANSPTIRDYYYPGRLPSPVVSYRNLNSHSAMATNNAQQRHSMAQAQSRGYHKSTSMIDGRVSFSPCWQL